MSQAHRHYVLGTGGGANKRLVSRSIVAPPKHRVVLCAILKNEPDLEEWAAYNKLIGFEHLYLYDNESKPPIQERLARFGDFVTVIPCPGVAMQQAAYTHFLRNYSDRTHWVAFFDGDEYLVLKQHASVGELIDSVTAGDGRCAGILVNWVMFGTCGHREAPDGLVIENYQWCMQKHMFRPNHEGRHVKSIVRPNCVVTLPNGGWTPHAFRLRGHYRFVDGRLAGPQPEPLQEWIDRSTGRSSLDIAQLNHYWSKSLAQWAEKIARGRATTSSKRRREEIIALEQDPKERDVTLAESALPARVRLLLAELKYPPIAPALSQLPDRTGFTRQEIISLTPAP